MPQDPIRTFAACNSRALRLEKRWQELCERYLPLSPQDSIWRYYHVPAPDEPTQGWKLHISATVLHAARVLGRIAPFLTARRVQFKAPRSLVEVSKLNSGLFYGYSQVGKIITVYPRTHDEAASLARQLHKMTRGTAGPPVPFDLRYGKVGNIYYRFGAFRHLEVEQPGGRRVPALRDGDGNLTPDVRTSESAKPDWVPDLFEGVRLRGAKREARDGRPRPYRVLRALVQRGKGGVYQALDLSVSPPRLCLIKEGRKDGETNWDGRDGAWRVRNEERVIATLSARGVNAPRVYSSFELEGNYYLVTEFIAGESLHGLLLRRARRMSVAGVLRYGIQLSDIFSRIHAAGWVWRDCKPVNVLVTPDGSLRPIDFEGACPVDEPDPLFWGTPGFTPPEVRVPHARTCAHDDLYALGAMLYLLLTGRVPETAGPPPVGRLRRNVPPTACEFIMRLLSRNAGERPSAESVGRELKAALSACEDRRPAPRQTLSRLSSKVARRSGAAGRGVGLIPLGAT